MKKRGTQGVEASKAIDQKYLSGLSEVKVAWANVAREVQHDLKIYFDR